MNMIDVKVTKCEIEALLTKRGDRTPQERVYVERFKLAAKLALRNENHRLTI